MKINKDFIDNIVLGVLMIVIIIYVYISYQRLATERLTQHSLYNLEEKTEILGTYIENLHCNQ